MSLADEPPRARSNKPQVVSRLESRWRSPSPLRVPTPPRARTPVQRPIPVLPVFRRPDTTPSAPAAAATSRGGGRAATPAAPAGGYDAGGLEAGQGGAGPVDDDPSLELGDPNSRCRRRAVAARLRGEGIDYRVQYFLHADRSQRAEADLLRIRQREAGKDSDIGRLRADVHRLRSERDALSARVTNQSMVMHELSAVVNGLVAVTTAPSDVRLQTAAAPQKSWLDPREAV
jgi:hypothetical protein